MTEYEQEDPKDPGLQALFVRADTPLPGDGFLTALNLRLDALEAESRRARRMLIAGGVVIAGLLFWLTISTGISTSLMSVLIITSTTMFFRT